MAHARAGHVADGEPLRTQPLTQVGILPVQKVALVEALHLVERGAPAEHARAGDPVGLSALVGNRRGNVPTGEA